MNRLHTNATLAMFLAFGVLATPMAARAQGPRQSTAGAGPAQRATRTFGVASSTSHTVQAFAFTGLTAADTAKFNSNLFGSRYCDAAPCSFEAAVSLPAGALVTAIELEACDVDPNASVVTTLFRVTPLESTIQALGSVSTGVSTATPGCQFFLAALDTAETVDNYSNTYQLEVVIDGATLATRFQAVRLYYNLQVSPPPTVPTFSDVGPLHPFFTFIEALNAAGITNGCSTLPPLFCPDVPVTRGQMAVFLGKALGLHWVP